MSFIADENGTAGVEFVTTVPILLGVLVFTAEYGEALRARMVLDNATHDVARFLARAPLDNQTVNPNPPQIAFYPQTILEAQAFMEARVLDDVVFEATLDSVDASNFRTDYHVISVRASSCRSCLSSTSSATKKGVRSGRS